MTVTAWVTNFSQASTILDLCLVFDPPADRILAFSTAENLAESDPPLLFHLLFFWQLRFYLILTNRVVQVAVGVPIAALGLLVVLSDFFSDDSRLDVGSPLLVPQVLVG